MDSPTAYIPLPCDRSLRLLTITGVEETAGEATSITCKLDIYKLDERCPAYVALSYTWGPPYDDPDTMEKYSADHDVTISVQHDDGTPCRQRIGRNLFEALVQIHKSEWQSYLWADALCINQDDPEERGHQVELMGDIYSDCDHVVAWLGPEPDNVAEILWWYGPFVERLQAYQSSNRPSWEYENYLDSSFKFPHVRMNRAMRQQNQAVLYIDRLDLELNRSKLLAIGDWFTMTRYFHRLWVFQELYLPEKVVYRLGQHVLSLLPEFEKDDVHAVINTWFGMNHARLRNAMALNGDLLPDRSWWIVTQPVQALWFCLDPAGGPNAQLLHDRLFGHPTSEHFGLNLLRYLVDHVSRFATSDPRDRLYGLLGIVRRMAPPSTPLPVVDYHISVRELVLSVSMTLRTCLPYLDAFALRASEARRSVSNLPSWAVDISADRLPPTWTLGITFYFETSVHSCELSSAATTSIVRIGDMLILDGHYCGHVDQTYPSSFTRLDTYNLAVSSDQEFFRSVFNLACELGYIYEWVENETILDAIPGILAPKMSTTDAMHGFWFLAQETLLTLAMIGTPADHDKAEASKACLYDCAKSFRGLLELEAIPPKFEPLARAIAGHDFENITKSFRSEADEHIATQFEVDFRIVASKTLLLTDDKHLGLVSSDVRPGDQVWLLCRAKVPHILRPLPDGRFISIGEAYVHGGMHNEMLQLGIAGPVRKIAIL